MAEEKEYESYEVPKEELPAGVSYRKVFGKRQEGSPKKTVNIQKIINVVERPGVR